nr:uncharacterized protein LOC112277641 isoform X1 [Physcomitrium patens]XP_024365967.1 uncharacterized protein LOC112277641 isoform X1 [Physcomitrium patens]XP_024365968.1 uncharacterized protein LOC112277641 isoform X1 [Physcomitrium patens]XP_024365969.1 uncharacterized protein LOC112277641 isoform X1 [Physcomitrium patens]|eukprot:XP_024365966.1 uncharacterized protein LOC112277641 isoform X1 [Physcomitrella patens]
MRKESLTLVLHLISLTFQAKCAQPLSAPQLPLAPCPPTPTQSDGLEVQGPENEMQALQSEEDKEDGTESSILTVPAADVHARDHKILEVDDVIEKNIVTEKDDTEEKNAKDTDEPSAEKLRSIVITGSLPDKRRLTTVFEPSVQQYKRTRIICPHDMKSVAASRAALIGAAWPKSPSKYSLQSETKEGCEKNYPEMWARKAFDAWRTANGHPTDLSIEDLSEQRDVRTLVDMLCEFISQLTKQNGQSYPPASIQAMLRAIGRIIRAREEQRTVETGIAKVPFSIYRDPRFLKVKWAVEDAVAKSAAIESAKEVIALEVHPPMNEGEMLNQCKFSNTHPEGCSRRFAYFCLRDFYVKGRSELRELSDVDFELFTDEHGECLRYTRGMGANWKHNIDNQPRHSIRCYISDVLEAYHTLMAHRPVWLDTEPPPHPIFLKSLPKWSDQVVWYAKAPVGKNKFSMWNQDVIASLGGLPDRATSKFDYAKFDYMVEATRVENA